MKSRSIRDSYLWVVLAYCLIFLVAAYAGLALLYPKSAPSGAIEWSVAMGTTLLAFFTFIATRESRRQTGIDRRMRFIESQLGGLHAQIIEQESNFMKSVVPTVEAFELIKKKKYLADGTLRLEINELLKDHDEYKDAAGKYEVVKDFLGGGPRDNEEKRDLKLKYDESRARLITCGIELVRLAREDYDALHDELQKLSGGKGLTEMEKKKEEHIERAGVHSVEINMDAMRTTLWQIFVGVFTAGYVTFFITLTFNVTPPVPGLIAGPLALGLGVLLAIMISLLFLMIIRVNPKRVFSLTDALVNWSLRRK